jgi:hypothetical protein
MTRESKILMADMTTMDPLARGWHQMYRDRIGKEVMAAQAATESIPSSAPSTHMFAPAYMPTAPSMSMIVLAFMPPLASTDDVPQVIADEENIVGV